MYNELYGDDFMKIKFFVVISLVFITNIFAQENETPAFLIELNTGYAIGINMPSSVPIEIKMVYPYNRFGFTIETGILLADNIGFHLFLGPTIFILNNPKIRIPVSLGFDIAILDKNKFYYGIGGIISFNYSLNKNIYCGFNLEINYNFNNPYNEIVGYKDAAIGMDENGNKIYPIDREGNPVLYMPILENRDHFGNNIYKSQR